MLPNPRLVARIAALWTAAAGLVDIVSALYPSIPNRLDILRDLLPLYLIRTSQTATVLVGIALIVLAAGLRKRRQRALQITVALLIASALFNLAKGLDVEEATVSLLLVAFHVRHRHVFHVQSAPGTALRALSRTAALVGLYYAYVAVGYVILQHAIRPWPDPGPLLLEPIRLLVGNGWYTYAGAQARWFEHSIPIIGCVAVLYSTVQMLRPFIPHHSATNEEIDATYDLVRRYGRDSLSYFTLQDGRNRFFHSSGEAVLSYRLWGSVALVGGDPVGADEYAGETIAQFIEFADANGLDPCFLGVSALTRSLYTESGLRTLKIGEEAVIELAQFDRDSLKRKVRRAARHVGESGFQAMTFRRDELPVWMLDEMDRLSKEWLRERGGRERGFSMTLGRLPREADSDCEFTVAICAGRVWGYLCFVPIYRASGWSLDAMRRRSDSPNGLMEFLVVSAAERFRERGYAAMSLNFATLSNREGDIDSWAIEGVRRILFDKLSGYYQLRSLYQFNDKFGPRWTSRYLAYRDVMSIPRLALAIVQSEDPFRLPLISRLARQE